MAQNTAVKSPFIILEDSISPLQCEGIVDSVEFTSLDVDKLNRQVETTKISEHATSLINRVIRSNETKLIEKYGAGISHLEDARVVWSNSSVKLSRPQSDNSARIKDKWLRVHNRDLTAMLFLSDFNDKPPFDSEFEVYGGKVEFPSHGFGFNPTRGTIIIMPSDPHFTHVYSPIKEGNMFVAKTFIALTTPLIYSPKNFPGTWSAWLSEHF